MRSPKCTVSSCFKIRYDPEIFNTNRNLKMKLSGLASQFHKVINNFVTAPCLNYGQIATMSLQNKSVDLKI